MERNSRNRLVFLVQRESIGAWPGVVEEGGDKGHGGTSSNSHPPCSWEVPKTIEVVSARGRDEILYDVVHQPVFRQ